MTQFTLKISTDGEPPENPTFINLSRLSLRTGYSPSHLSRVFSGKTVPSLKCLNKMGEALKMDITTLYNVIKEGKVNVRKPRSDRI